MLPSSRPPRSHAFTLVELLTVIAIIAVLMGILFPTISGAIENAKKVQAKSDEQAIITAIKAYYAEYGRYPVDAAIGAGADFTYGSGKNSAGNADQSDLMNVLRYPYSGKAGSPTPSAKITDLNPRKIVFLEVKAAKDLGKANKEREGIGSVGTATDKWLDPWGNEYAIKLDADYDGSITNPYGAGANAGSTELALGVIVWTSGRNNVIATNVKGSDDVLSWQ